MIVDDDDNNSIEVGSRRLLNTSFASGASGTSEANQGVSILYRQH